MLRKERKYHIIYETICLINGKKYLGMHSSDTLNDDYLGSGLLLTRAINKYGIEYFKRTNIHIFDNFDDMVNKEKEIVNEEVLLSPEYYNIMKGGYGGAQYGEAAKKISNALTKIWEIMPLEQKIKRMEKLHASLTPEMRSKNASGIKNGMYGKTHTKDTKLKLSKNSKKRDRQIYKFIHVNGSMFEGEMAEFYIKYKLCRILTSRVINGTKNQIKGWRLDTIESHKIFKNNQQSKNAIHKLKHNDGLQFFEGTVTDFCDKHKVNKPQVYAVVNKVRKSVKGWRLYDQ